jgi:hypothetical protein
MGSGDRLLGSVESPGRVLSATPPLVKSYNSKVTIGVTMELITYFTPQVRVRRPAQTFRRIVLPPLSPLPIPAPALIFCQLKQ